MRRAAKTNLRSRPLIGRARELAALAELLQGGTRLITICGPAGTGKTRVAQAFGMRALPSFDGPGGGGVWFVSLASARTIDSAIGAIERTLDIPPGPTADPAESVARLGAAIAARGPILLLLDNFEQLVDAAARDVATLLTLAPDLRLAVTSREALRIDSETRFPLDPLALPGEGTAAIADADAVQLFVSSVARVDPGFSVHAENAQTIAALVRKLDGIPLAIELAASRVDVLGLDALLANLDGRLDVLARTGRDGDARHATLAAAIEWSWDLLDEPERAALAQCSVFRGGFTAHAADAVLQVDGSVLDRLQSLREKSLLHREDPKGTAPPRFRLLHSVAAYAASRCLDADAVADRHALAMLAMAEPWSNAVGGRESVAALAKLQDDAENLGAALEHARERLRDDPTWGTTVARLTLCLDALASVRGTAREHRALVEDSLAAVDLDALEDALRVRALRARGRLRFRHGQSTTALRDLDAALVVAERGEDPHAQSEVLVELALYHHHRRELSTARVLYERALTQARAAEATALEGRVLGNLGALHHDSRRFDEASAHYQDALGLLQTAGDQRLEAIHVANLGILEQERGQLPQARAHFSAARELLEALDDRRLLAIVEGNVGNLEHELGNATEARTCHERALSLLRETGDRRSEALCLGRLARTNASLAWLDDARGCLQAADRLLGRYPDPLVRAAIEVDRGFLDVADLRQGRACNDADAVEAATERVQARIRAATEPRDEALPWVAISDDIRTAVRTLEAELARSDAGTDANAAAARPALVVGPEGKWMRPPGKDPQDFRRRRSLRLILVALTQRHREVPGAGISLEGLLAAGWPGERVVPTAGANRVYVALTTLRKLGLRGHLLSQDDGYLLDPALPVERSNSDWESLRAAVS